MQDQNNQLLTSLQEQYPVLYKQVVAWGEMDAFQHINNVHFYRYIESARIAYVSELGIMNDKMHIVIYTSSCKYLSPVVYPDTLYIGTRIVEMRNSSFKMVYDLYSSAQKQLVAQAEAVIVTIDSATTSKMSIPNDIKEKIIAIEKASGHTVEIL